MKLLDSMLLSPNKKIDPSRRNSGQSNKAHLQAKYPYCMDEFIGYVILGKDGDREKPFGVITNDGERHAIGHRASQRLKKCIVEAEDKRFFKHSGIDIRGVTRAAINNFKSGSISEGGSTISQQLARNLLRDNRKSIVRKIKESILALKLERNYSKDQIIDMYFDNVFFGKNIRGLRAASLSYFGKEPHSLTAPEELFLITLLRGPNYYLKNLEKANARYMMMNNLLLDRSVYSPNRHRKNLKKLPVRRDSNLSAIRAIAVPSFIKKVDHNTKTLISNIDVNLQKFVNKFVEESGQKISIVVVAEGNLIASSSFMGFDYPILTKTNIGSTLKPADSNC